MLQRDWPEWLLALNDDDLSMMKEFVLQSGSLKALAVHYDVTYPTIRLRLDRLIDRIRHAEERQESAFESLLKELTLQEDIKPGAARRLLSLYEKETRQARE